jgi:hypothetical protein
MNRNYDTCTKAYSTNDRDIQDDRIIQLMTNWDEINHLLHLTGKSHFRFSDSIDITRVDGRLLFNINIRDRASSLRQRLHIDVINGVPTFEQVADCVYGLGADADQRMIIYDEDFNFHLEGHPGSTCLVADLIALANANGIPFSLVRAKNISNIKDKRISYDLNTDAFYTERDAPRDFPTRRQLLEGEFWSFYYHLHWAHQGAGPVESLESAFGPWEPGYSIGDKRTKAVWNDDGLFMCVEGILDDDDMIFLKDHINFLQDEYPSCPINIEVGDELILSVRVLDVPMKDLIEMSPEKKWEYGEYLYDEEHHFAEVVEEAFIKHEQLKKGNAIPPQ